MASAPRIQFVVTNVDYKRRDPVFWIEVQVKKKKNIPQKKKKNSAKTQYLKKNMCLDEYHKIQTKTKTISKIL